MPQASHHVSPQQACKSVCDLISSVALALVEDQDSVEVLVQEDDGCTTIMLSVSPSDLGKLIGKEGRMARSIRTILSAASMKQQRRYALDIRTNPPLPVDPSS